MRRRSENDEAYPLLIFRDDETLVGGLTVGQMRRGVSQTGTLGYWMGGRPMPGAAT